MKFISHHRIGILLKLTSTSKITNGNNVCAPIESQATNHILFVSLGRNYTIEVEKSNLSNVRRNALKVVIHFELLFFSSSISAALDYRLIPFLIAQVNYNCIETILFQIVHEQETKAINK